MARLLEVYEEMLKEAEFAKVAEEIQFMFAKYAETAESLLKEEYGTDFNKEDVESLARGLMERDSEIIEETQKVAEYEQIGRTLAQEFAKEVKTAAAAGTLVSKAKDLGKKVLLSVSEKIKAQPVRATAIGATAGVGAGVAAGHMLSGGDK